MSDESDDDAPEQGILTPPFKKPIVEPVAVQDEEISRHPAVEYQGAEDVITPEDHAAKIPEVPFTVPVARKNRLVARHEMEGTPPPGNNTDANASGNTNNGGDQNAQNIQFIFNMLNCFHIDCEVGGELSWSFECDEE